MKKIALWLVGFSSVAFIAWAANFVRLPPEGPARDRAIPAFELSGESLRIAALGTSLTANYSWPDDLATSLVFCLGLPVEIVTMAKPGAGSEWGLTQVPALLALQPDLVLVEFAVNDADIRDGVRLDKSIAQHRQIVETLQASASAVAVHLLTTNPVIGLRRFTRPSLDMYFHSYVELAAALDTGLGDIHARWLAQADINSLIEDGVHPQNKVASDMIVPPLTDQIAIALGRTCID